MDKLEKYGFTVINEGKAPIENVARIVDKEGLGHAVQRYLKSTDIEDKKLAGLWRTAKENLDAIEKILKPYLGK